MISDPRLGTTDRIRTRRLYWLRMLVTERDSCGSALPGGALGRGATPDLAAMAQKGLVRNTTTYAERLWEPTDEGRALAGSPRPEPPRLGDIVRVMQANHLLTGQEAEVVNPHWSDTLAVDVRNENGGDVFRHEDVEVVRRAAS